MHPQEIAFLCVAVGAISLFGGVLAWASFMEWWASKKKAQHPRARASGVEEIAIGGAARRSF
jgi:hypothetical protein